MPAQNIDQIKQLLDAIHAEDTVTQLMPKGVLATTPTAFGCQSRMKTE